MYLGSIPSGRTDMKTYSGIVQRGLGRGEALSFRTANIPLEDATLSGVHIARATIGHDTYPAAVFIDTKRKLLEAHLLDFFGDLYGKEISVQLLRRIRDEKRFESDADLRSAIESDIRAVRNYFAKKENI